MLLSFFFGIIIEMVDFFEKEKKAPTSRGSFTHR